MGADRLSSRDLVAGEEARRLCPLPLARGVVPESRLSAAYDALRGFHGERADPEYVRILYLAAVSGEQLVERALGEMLDGGERFERTGFVIQSDRAAKHSDGNDRRAGPKVYDALLAEERMKAAQIDVGNAPRSCSRFNLSTVAPS